MNRIILNREKPRRLLWRFVKLSCCRSSCADRAKFGLRPQKPKLKFLIFFVKSFRWEFSGSINFKRKIRKTKRLRRSPFTRFPYR